MALPTQEDIVTMDIASRGLPYLDVPAKSSIDTQLMDTASRGLPFVTNDDFDGGAPTPTDTFIGWRMLMGVGR